MASKRRLQNTSTSRTQNETKDDVENPADFDAALEMVGTFGWSQFLHLALLNYAGMSRAVIMVSAVFLTKIPPNFRCKDRISDDPCLLDPPCQEFNFTTPDNFTSVVSEWDLVCDKKEYAGLTQSALMIGMMLGTYFFAPLADQYGRWPIMTLGNVCIFLGHALAFLSVSYVHFVVARFVVGLGLGGSLPGTVWIVDNAHSKWRSIASMSPHLSYSIGIVVLAGFGYYFRDWRDLVFYTACLLLLFIILCRTIPESPRWLLSKGRIREAEDVLVAIAKGNGIQISRQEFALSKFAKDEAKDKVARNVSTLSAFSSPKMRTRMLVLMWLWAICVLVYYGLILGASNLGGDMYVNVAISGLVGIPGNFLGGYLSDRLGRKASVILCTLFTSCSCLGILVLPYQPSGEMTPIQTNVAIVAKLWISVAFDLLWVYTGELLPTEIRSGALGFCSMVGRIGGVIQPMVSSTGTTFAYTVFGLTTLVSCGVCMILPETLNKSLPDTVQDIEMDSNTEEEKKKL